MYTVTRDLKPHGYDMVCTDGFIPMLDKDASGYMTHYVSTALKDLVATAEAFRYRSRSPLCTAAFISAAVPKVLLG